MKHQAFLLVFMILLSPVIHAQDEDLLGLVSKDSLRKEYVHSAFKSSRVIMSHSIELLRPGVLDFRILHRFGRVSGGSYEFFGLDGPATIRLGLDYGLSNSITVGVGRSTTRKELDGFVKYRPIQQATGPKASPVSLVMVAGSTLSTLKWADPSRENFFSSRMGYYGQVLLGRKFSEALTLQVMPTVVHQNLVAAKADHNDLYAAGVGGRLKLSKRTSLNADYYYVLNQNTSTAVYNPLSLGFDLETGGHVFQLHFTNSKGMNERAFIADTDYSWAKGDIMFGFNISRSFQVKKKKG